MPELIKSPEQSTTALTKAAEHRAMKTHLLMMLEAMQYKGSTKHLGNESLRTLVEEQKVIFLRKMQHEVEKEHMEKYGRPLATS